MRNSVLSLIAVIVLAARPAAAAITIVGHIAAFSTSSNTFTTASQDTTGANFIVVTLSEGGSVNNGVVSDNKGNTWTKLTQQLNGGKSNELWYAFNATVGTGHTFTATGTGDFPAMGIAWFSGVQSSSDPFDVQNGATVTFGSTVQPGSVTPSQANSLVITGFEADNNATPLTISSPFTVADSITDTNFGHQNAAIAYEIQTTATARNPTWTDTANSTLCSAIAVFKPSGGAAAPTPQSMMDFWGMREPDPSVRASPMLSLRVRQ